MEIKNVSIKNYPILDACCGGRMFYFDKHDSRVLFQDIRDVETTLCDGRHFEVKPDIQADQKKFIGNAVEVNMARVLCEALCRSLSGIGNARNKRGRTSGTYSLTLNTQI